MGRGWHTECAGGYPLVFIIIVILSSGPIHNVSIVIHKWTHLFKVKEPQEFQFPPKFIGFDGVLITAVKFVVIVPYK